VRLVEKTVGAVGESGTFWRGIQTGHDRQSQLALDTYVRHAFHTAGAWWSPAA